MPENLVEQLEEQLKIAEKNRPDKDRFTFFIAIACSKENLVEKARGVFKKHHLKDLDQREKVLVFQVHKHSVPGEQGVEDLKSTLNELDNMGIEGILGSHPTIGGKH